MVRIDGIRWSENGMGSYVASVDRMCYAWDYDELTTAIEAVEELKKKLEKARGEWTQ